MNTTYSAQIEAIQKARTSISLLRDLADLQNGPPLETVRKEWEETIQNVYNILNEIEDSEALNDAGSSLAALNLSDPYKEIERLQAKLKEAESLPTPASSIIGFLLGSSHFDGVWYGEKHPQEKGSYWWRKHLRHYIESKDARIAELEKALSHYADVNQNQ